MNDAELSELAEAVTGSYFVQAVRVGGIAALRALRQAMSAVSELYRTREARSLDGSRGLALVVPVPTWMEVSVPDHANRRTSLTSAAQSIGPDTVVLVSGAECAFWPLTDGIDIDTLSMGAVIYRFCNGRDSFVIRGTQIPVEKDWQAGSAFESLAFKTLVEAFEYYSTHLSRDSTCRILRGIWHDADTRLLLTNKPEHIMRDSLEQFLRSHLRGWREIMPEQNVDESRPVDIKVTWESASRIALVEIKWLGQSVDDAGNPGTEYTPVRARQGAGQLADYLDRMAVRAGEQIHRGYLVVFDARRGAVGGCKTKDRSVQLWKYEHDEIQYDPKFHLLRNDFEQPVRLFLRPGQE